MNRIGILLASALAGVALLVVAYSGVRASRAPAAVHAAPGKSAPNASVPETAKISAGQGDGDRPVIRFVKNPEPIPLFMARDLDGNVISTAALKGKVTLVNFWATWCPPCRQEIPELVQLQDEFKDQLQIIAISEDEAPPAAVKAFARSARINYPIVILTPEIEKGFGGVPALPTSFLVNKDGGVMNKHVGYYTIDVYEREIRALEGLEVDAKIETFEDTGELFLKNAANATELPGVDLSQLTPQQKQIALKRFNSETCTCGCTLTLAQCRINDSACPTSREIAAKIVKEIQSGKSAPPPAKPADSSSTD